MNSPELNGVGWTKTFIQHHLRNIRRLFRFESMANRIFKLKVKHTTVVHFDLQCIVVRLLDAQLETNFVKWSLNRLDWNFIPHSLPLLPNRCCFIVCHDRFISCHIIPMINCYYSFPDVHRRQLQRKRTAHIHNIYIYIYITPALRRQWTCINIHGTRG